MQVTTYQLSTIRIVTKYQSRLCEGSNVEHVRIVAVKRGSGRQTVPQRLYKKKNNKDLARRNTWQRI